MDHTFGDSQCLRMKVARAVWPFLKLLCEHNNVFNIVFDVFL